MMNTLRYNIQSVSQRVMTLAMLLILHSLFFTLHSFAQEVTINVQPIQQVLPPQAGQYVDNPGKFFIVRLTNNTDEQQLLHIGLQMEKRFPEDMLMVQTRYGHIPRMPITLAPHQVKTLNPVEMKNLFAHYNLEDVYIKDGTYQDYRDGIFGLLPEGQYELFLTAYKWDPYLVSPVTLSDPKSGSTLFNVCYKAQPPRFLTPIQNIVPDDPLSMFAVTKVNRQNALFTWASPTLNCNATLISFQYNARIVRLGTLSPDEAMDRNPVVFERNRLVTPQLNIPEAYIRQMLGDQALSEVFALQITAYATGLNNNTLNYTLIENDGKSAVYLFRLHDPSKEKVEEEEKKEEEKKPEEDEGYKLELEGTDEDLLKEDSLYIFEQPTITQPNFSNDPMGRKVFFGEDIKAEWRKAWYCGGRGEEQDTVKFEYTVQLFTGNAADTPEGIFAGKPILEHKTSKLKDTLKWDDFKSKVSSGEYMMLRVTAKSTNEKSIRMLGDSLNFIDFALSKHFEDDFECGTNTANVTNKELITKLPEKGTNLQINSWYLTLNDDSKLDKKKHTISGTGWIAWSPVGNGNVMNCRVAVKFDALKVNTDNVVFEGKCQTYAKSSDKNNGFTAEQVVDSIFSQTGLDNIWGNLALPKDVKDKVSKTVEGEVYDVAKAYKLGQYYSYLKQVQNKWGSANNGNIDLYFPCELPKEISNKLPKDFSVQIASMTFSPKAAVMNLIGMIALPNSDVIKNNDVLVFGCPRLCISQNQILPEDGVLSLLSNFKIQDPGSDFSLTFVAPRDPLNPILNDGCFIRWENNEFGGLGLEIAATIPNTKRVVDGKVQKDLPALLDLRTTIRGNESAGDFIAYGSMTPFQVNDLPDWTFNVGEEVIFDHNLSENGNGMPSLDDIKSWAGNTYDPKKCGTVVQTDWNAWQGVYIKEVKVGFPKFAVFGSGDKGVSVGVQNMIIDGSGVTCKVFTDNLLDAKTGSCGGWKFSIDKAQVNIVQNNFDQCEIKGGFGIPLFGKKATGNGSSGKSGKPSSSNDVETDVTYTCQIRHLTDPTKTETYYTYDETGKNKIKHTRQSYGDKNRYAYIFKTDQVDDLYMNCFVADLKIIKEQTYFVVAAEEQESGQMKTDVELRMAGDITIANTQSVNKKLADISKKLPMKISMPGIHFAKLRLSNFKDADRKNSLVYKYAKDKIDAADEAEEKWKKSNTILKTLATSKELELSPGNCYLDLGEWSLASLKKKIGPFSFELSNYKFGYAGSKLTLDINGKIGLCGDKVTADAGITINSGLSIPSDKTDISGYKLSDGQVEFKELTLKCDFASVLKLDGILKVVKDSTDANGNKLNGYAGKVKMEIKGLFGVDCQGGYYSVTTNDTKVLDQVKKDAKEEGVEQYANDKTFSYGYFMVEISSGAGIRMDPLVINRIAGGFYFNCRPKWNEEKKKFDLPIADYGCIGVSLGMGFSTSAGEQVLKASVDLNVVYKKGTNGKGGSLTTFLFKGTVTAVSGMIDAKMTLLYQNDDKDRFLSLDITVTAGIETGVTGSFMKAANAELEKYKNELDKFQGDISKEVKGFVADANGGLDKALGDNDNHKKSTESTKTGDLNKEAKKKQEQSEKSRGTTVSLPFQLKITWKENGVTKSPTRWHLYLGEPEKSKRCQIILIDFKSKIVNVNIGADAYLCIGNELPGNGKLPDIPKEITDFLTPNGVDTGADMAKAQRSRNAACQAMMGTDVKGGLMVGASAWGFIDIDLGLFYGGLKAIAGFDMALVNYGDAAYCVNLKRTMGKNGWYATGQFYAYLAAKFGLHIYLGKLLDRRIDIVDAGIGGVFQAGLPSPSWVDGRARVKLKLLGGLININKSFHFECGDYCEAFVGNAIDGFSLFGDCNIAADSLALGWDENNAILARDGNKMMITTAASLNSQYRLLDPSTQKNLADQSGYDAETLKMHSSRTYIFDWDNTVQFRASAAGRSIQGARLIEINETGLKNLQTKKYGSNALFENKDRALRSQFHSSSATRGTWYTVMNASWKTKETSIIMKDRDLNSLKVKDDAENAEFEKMLEDDLWDMPGITDVPVYIRETQGTRFHLSATLKPNRYYMLVLTGKGYEVEGGKRYWIDKVETNSKGKLETFHQQWIQHKFFYFRTKGEESIPATPTDLKSYVALAYPAGDDLALFNSSADKAKAYDGDLALPTIALNQDISTKAYKDGRLYWELRDRRAGYTDWDNTQKRDNVYKYGSNNSSVNMEPASSFSIYRHSAAKNKSDMEYNLRLCYQYRKPMNCATGLEEYASDQEKWAAYRGFIKNYSGYVSKFNTYKNSVGYGNIDMDQVLSAKECTKMLLVARKWIESDAGVKSIWNTRWITGRAKEKTCYQDTVILLSDLYFRGMDEKSWRTKGIKANGSYYLNSVLPYEKAFVGIRPNAEPQYQYSSVYKKISSGSQYLDVNVGFRNQAGIMNRTDDPYLYFAYLSNWVFLAGLQLNKYDFDDVKIPHATETLTFSYNGVDVQGGAFIEGMGENMLDVRNRMYGIWNDWHYDSNSAQPEYPLPSGNGPIYDYTFANQDGKTSSYLRAYDNAHPEYPYVYALREYIRDFAAPYYVAKQLKNKMSEIATMLYNYHRDYRINYSNNSTGNNKYNTALNNAVKNWNKLHRGQYLTIESRGFSVKVPYYQFPLIFGDCFGTGTGFFGYDPNIGKDKPIERKNRSFKFSVASGEFDRMRWNTEASNLVFFRLFGGYPWAKYNSTAYANAYRTLVGKDYVEMDVFDPSLALRKLTSMPMKIYRVDTYNINNGQYYYNGRGAASITTYSKYFKEQTFDPIKDSDSRAKRDAWKWIDTVGLPTVTTNDTQQEDSFDKDKKK
ncbi:MAG: hypothetical protein K6F89_07120 [Prevotella sp.]|nr:hypothetical protein [Prevotella sp.]